MAYYLDLFNGNPEDGGTSILGIITGSTARIDVTDDLEITTFPVEALVNPDRVVITEAALAGANVSYVAIYDAATNGEIQYLHRVGSHYTISKGNLVQFVGLALSFVIPPEAEVGQWAFNDPAQSGQILTCGI